MQSADLSRALVCPCLTEHKEFLKKEPTYLSNVPTKDSESASAKESIAIDVADESTLSSSISPGIPLNDLQLNLSYVVDELVMRQRLYEQRMKDEGILAEDSGGWQGLYGAFKKAKKALTEAGRQEMTYRGLWHST